MFWRLRSAPLFRLYAVSLISQSLFMHFLFDRYVLGRIWSMARSSYGIEIVFGVERWAFFQTTCESASEKLERAIIGSLWTLALRILRSIDSWQVGLSDQTRWTFCFRISTLSCVTRPASRHRERRPQGRRPQRRRRRAANSAERTWRTIHSPNGGPNRLFSDPEPSSRRGAGLTVYISLSCARRRFVFFSNQVSHLQVPRLGDDIRSGSARLRGRHVAHFGKCQRRVSR